MNSEPPETGLSSIPTEAKSVQELFPIVYDELRELAHRWSKPGKGLHQSLQPTAIVHEAFLRLLKNPELTWTDRNHFFAIAATAMRHFIHDHVRNRSTRKRGGDWRRITLTESIHSHEGEDIDALALTEAIDRLETLKKRHSSIVEMRLFGGLEFKDIADTLGVSTRTVERDWRTARAWLKMQLEGRELP